MSQPRAEYPRPQFVRAEWVNLNGEWQFEIDRSDSGLERGVRERELAQRITVPFAPETQLSGIENVDFLEAVWYRTTVDDPGRVGRQGRRTALPGGRPRRDRVGERRRGGPAPRRVHAVQRQPEQGRQAGRGSHDRGPRPRHPVRPAGARQADASRTSTTAASTPGPPASGRPSGSRRCRPCTCGRPRITPDVAGSSFHLAVPVSANKPGWKVRATLKDADGEVATAEVRADLDLAPRLTLQVPADRVRLWDTDRSAPVRRTPRADRCRRQRCGHRGQLRRTAVGVDQRSGDPDQRQARVPAARAGPGLLAGEPDDGAVRRGAGPRHRAEHRGRVQRRAAAPEGVRGAVPVPRGPARATWSGASSATGARDVGDTGDDNQQPTASYVAQWLEAVERDYSHPSIIGWCPLNETHQLLHDRITQLDDVTRAMFLATKAADTTRPVLDASGYSHRVPETDVWDSHNYEQDPAEFAQADGRPRGRQRRTGTPAVATGGRSPSRTPVSRTSAASSAASGGTPRRPRPASGQRPRSRGVTASGSRTRRSSTRASPGWSTRCSTTR